ncbi:MAG: hypothetical protein SCARUB_02786 [Candidatus Scalindua rubra]|uniref:Uncharacterized protein n=1 Tax=Candidatus Scalindua rubra TaxID=1872076 RepID=A0A1E3X923_9BACT|nr:MAG: hypothetical protein SCARUB_02786 [Candidatus Scalindua rubra]
MPNKKIEEHIVSTNYKKKKGLLYILDKDGDLAEARMCGMIGRDKGGKPIYASPNKVLKLNIQREKGYLYFIKESKDKTCEVWRNYLKD